MVDLVIEEKMRRFARERANSSSTGASNDDGATVANVEGEESEEGAPEVDVRETLRLLERRLEMAEELLEKRGRLRKDLEEGIYLLNVKEAEILELKDQLAGKTRVWLLVR